MYHNWLDQWDERRAKRGDEAKRKADFLLGSELAFSSVDKVSDITDFGRLAEKAANDPTFYDDPNETLSGFEVADGRIKFPSGIVTHCETNNVVWAKVTESGSLDHALVVFHHWNATKRNRQIASFFSKRGITVVEIALPYHFERSRPGSKHADFMLSSNLGRTIQSTRQAVWDGRKLIHWLKNEGYGQISVLGMSLGSWVAGLVAAHEPAVSKASLFLTAGSLADMVWTGRATLLIRESLEPYIELTDLNRAWHVLNLETYAEKLSRPDLNLQIVLAKRDTVVLPELSARLLGSLKKAGAKPDILNLNCGHYSLSLPPHIIFAGWRLKRLLGR